MHTYLRMWITGSIHQVRMLDMAQRATLLMSNPMLIKLSTGLFDPSHSTMLGGTVS